eukprot:TRINITY_DN13993_c1_g1_i1.p1 TRINITY_DN13993_c1_g1~~TRINITY_DN13993_c1_g1_i1.p1  ORF type:complete len:456 (+),score=48.73 TRINITY_DN13993_c1_g1_i1:99-1466(+)
MSFVPSVERRMIRKFETLIILYMSSSAMCFAGAVQGLSPWQLQVKLRVNLLPLSTFHQLLFCASTVVSVRAVFLDDVAARSAVVRKAAEPINADAQTTPASVHWGFGIAPGVSKQVLQEFEDWDRSHGWSAAVRPGINLSDVEQWPPMPRVGTLSLGLQDPQIWVLSMRSRVPRRQIFSRRFEELCLGVGARWAPAVDGTTVPEHLRWLGGTSNSQAFDHDKPGMWACYISHLAIIRESELLYPNCDLVVFEDDVLFAPKFVDRWRRFVDHLPSDWDILRIGASAFWEPLLERVNDFVVKPRSVANTWGYVVRASKVKLLGDKLASLPKRSYGIDDVMNHFNDDGSFVTYAPAENLLQGVGGCHETGEERVRTVECETKEFLLKNALDVLMQWPQGYWRTYCSGPGEPHDNVKDSKGCKGVDPQAFTCCPYSEPPRTSEIRAGISTSFVHNYCPA